MQLPLIEHASTLFNEIDLKDYFIIGVQHILPSTAIMCDSLLEKGLKKENLALLGKCYSTDHETFHKMQNEGIDVSDLCTHFDSHENYDRTFKNKIKEFLEKRKHLFNSSKYKKIIVLDDGGELLEELENYVDDFSKISAMEQTSSGFNRLTNKSIKFPIINMARSNAKLSLETKIIVNNSLRKIFERIDLLGLPIKKILILGNGEIGATLYSEIQKNYEVSKYDKKSNKSDFDQSLLNLAISQADLIIGCSGNISITKDQHKYLKKDVVLASLSSSDREFDAVHLRKVSSQTSNPWQTLKCNDIYLLNCGFPISFDNDNVDDPNFFQFIRSLIMSSIYQAIGTENQTGFIDLDENLQNMMIDKFDEYRAALILK